MREQTEGMLSPYRVLDLTDEKGQFCGKILGDLGADVIKIEPPGGEGTRHVGPFYHDEQDPEKSLYWFAFNTSKRGITLDIRATEGQTILKRLVTSADFLIESFPPGYLDELGLGCADLEKINPGLIMISISPFGQTGPYKDYQAPDIVAWALGGVTLHYGDADRPPLWIGQHPQIFLHAGTEAAVGAMMALYYRQKTGEGQHVDVSIQAAAARGANLFIAAWDMLKVNTKREQAVGHNIRTRGVWPCKDGYVIWRFMTGQNAERIGKPLADWIEEEGFGDDYIRGFDWSTFDLRTMAQEDVDRLYEPAARLFMAHTKAELLEGAVKRRIQLYPVATTEDVVGNTQLAAREFWQEVEHPELGTKITYPGAFAKATEAQPGVTRRAPLIGEHNQEIYEGELGMPGEEVARLREARVI